MPRVLEFSWQLWSLQFSPDMVAVHSNQGEHKRHTGTDRQVGVLYNCLANKKIFYSFPLLVLQPFQLLFYKNIRKRSIFTKGWYHRAYLKPQVRWFNWLKPFILKQEQEKKPNLCPKSCPMISNLFWNKWNAIYSI